jgi:CheY-like chemotaxis protein
VSGKGYVMNKKTIVYCDDQQRFRDLFLQRHGSRYDIVTLSDPADLLKTVEQLKKLPDLILMDLYHPRDDDPNHEKKKALAEISLAKLDAQLEETNKAVLSAWEPEGLEVLKLIRGKYSKSELPVVIYSQKGLMLLSDQELLDAEINGADWLIKKKLSARTEQVALDRIMRRTPAKISDRIARTYRWLLAFSWAVIGLLIARFFFSSSQFADVMVAVVVGIVTALISYILSPILAKWSDKNSDNDY